VQSILSFYHTTEPAVTNPSLRLRYTSDVEASPSSSAQLSASPAYRRAMDEMQGTIPDSVRRAGASVGVTGVGSDDGG
jgi:hypothetical protein